MSNPKELWENTHMADRAYPIQFFSNREIVKRVGDSILYLHWHAHMEIIIVRQGRATFYIDSQPVEMKQGDVAFVPGGSLHVGYSYELGEFVFDVLVFNSSLFHEWLDDKLHINLLAKYLEGKENFPLLLSALPYYKTELEQELEQIVQELKRKEHGYQLVVKAKLYAWLIGLSRITREQPPGEPHEAYFANRDSFKKLIEWIKQNYASKPTVKQAAQMVGLDQYYFCKQFKKLTGRTFIEFVNIYRVSKAEELLKSSEATVSEIALSIGCENTAYFTRLYKQYMGVTPSESRKSSVK